MRDTVADALIRIKNGYLASKLEVFVPFSKLTLEIIKLLEKEGYIGGFKETEKDVPLTLKGIVVSLKYEGKKPALSDVKRISKPGLRVYKGSRQLPRVLNGLGMAIISTPKGIMSEKEARKESVGGEVMAYVW